METGTQTEATTQISAVVVENLHYSYPNGMKALSGVSFSVQIGESVAIVGANGAGKSTLLLHLNGILQGSSGMVSIMGLPVEKRTMREVRRRVGIVFQDPEDQLFMPTVAQDVAFGPSNMGLSKSDIQTRVEDSLAAVDMRDFAARSSHLLSFGEKKRIATATVLAMNPDILVLDEPTSSLDPKARRQLINIVNDLPVCKIIVTHDLPAAYEMCPRTIILHKGQITADGPTAELFANSELLEANNLELPYRFQVTI